MGKAALPIGLAGLGMAAPFMFPALGAGLGAGAAGLGGTAAGAGAGGVAGSSLGLAGLPSAVTSFGAPAAGAGFSMGGSGMGGLLAGMPAAGGGSLGLAGLLPGAGTGIAGFQNPGMLAQLGEALGKVDMSKLGQLQGLMGQPEQQQQQSPIPMGQPLPVGGGQIPSGPGMAEIASRPVPQMPGQQGAITPEMLAMFQAALQQQGGGASPAGMTQRSTSQPVY